MGTVLIAMPKSEDALRIQGLIAGYGLMLDTEICNLGSEILRIATDRDFGVVVCTRRLRDMEYLELSEYLPKNFSMIVLTRDASLEIFSDKMVRLILPMRSSDLISTIKLLMAPYLKPSRKKGKGPRVKSEKERRTINQAKVLLMEQNGMTEPEAFRYIQKASMNSGRTMLETAEMILFTNDA